jgi:hypothetical protein
MERCLYALMSLLVVSTSPMCKTSSIIRVLLMLRSTSIDAVEPLVLAVVVSRSR